jgi:pimeloyl-ACP methyl ester carboxylesterase
MPPPAASDAWLDQRYAAPQTLVKIGRRRRLNLLVAGEGGPAVVFAAGLIGTTLHWARVQPAVARKTRTIAFDKAGFGFSDAGPMPRPASAIVQDLRAALQAVGVAPPYVLVGHSAGGPQMRLFAFRHPQDVAGMVMVDSAGEHQYRRMDAAVGSGENDALRRELRRTYSRLAALARSGALLPGTADFERAVGPRAAMVTPALWAAHVAQRTSPAYWRAIRSEAAAADGASSDEIVAARRPLGALPLVVLTADRFAPRPGETPEATRARREVWVAMHDEIAALSTRGVRRTVDGAGHNIPMDQPQAVIEAVEEVLAAARAS